jgi:hypothetical protein
MFIVHLEHAEIIDPRISAHIDGVLTLDRGFDNNKEL